MRNRIEECVKSFHGKHGGSRGRIIVGKNGVIDIYRDGLASNYFDIYATKNGKRVATVYETHLSLLPGKLNEIVKKMEV